MEEMVHPRAKSPAYPTATENRYTDSPTLHSAATELHESCNTSCNSSCNTICNTSCNTSCYTSCNTSCNTNEATHTRAHREPHHEQQISNYHVPTPTRDRLPIQPPQKIDTRTRSPCVQQPLSCTSCSNAAATGGGTYCRVNK